MYGDAFPGSQLALDERNGRLDLVQRWGCEVLDRVVLGRYAERIEFVLINGPLVQRYQGTHAGGVEGT